jgi:hypothetical protein
MPASPLFRRSAKTARQTSGYFSGAFGASVEDALSFLKREDRSGQGNLDNGVLNCSHVSMPYIAFN